MQNHPPATHQSPVGWALVSGDWLMPIQEWIGYAEGKGCRTHYKVVNWRIKSRYRNQKTVLHALKLQYYIYMFAYPK